MDEFDEENEAELINSFLRVANEQRLNAIAQGFSQEAAEAVALNVHAGLVSRYFTVTGSVELSSE